jgi:geranylgeranyl reductase family protein
VRYDAIVVGAGPAGSTTAYRLARAGARVCLLDRATFPRDKPCGGGLTYRAVRELPFSVEPVVEDVVDRLELGLAYGRRFTKRSDQPLILMTQRRRLDAFLAERAAEAGAEFRGGTKVTAVSGDGVVDVGRERLQADVVVGADGANGVTQRIAEPVPELGVALEGNVRHADVDADRYRGRAVVELGVVPGGYAWVFPKGDHVNVGVGGWGSEGPRLRERLADVCRAYGIDESRVVQLRGHRLPMRGARRRPSSDRVLLVGDAAGLVDPLSGDGMYEAFVSSRIAAEHILDDRLDEYAPALHRELDALASAGWGAKKALDRFPRTVFTIMRLPFTWGVLEKLMLGEVAHPGAASGPGLTAMRAIKTLARAA